MLSGHVKRPWKYCRICTLRMNGNEKRLHAHWLREHPERLSPAWLMLGLDYEYTVYSNFDDHCNDPEGVVLKWKPEHKQKSWSRHKSNVLEQPHDEGGIKELIIDDLFATTAP